MERLFKFQKCMSYLQRFMTFWMGPSLNRLLIELVFWPVFLFKLCIQAMS